MIKILTRSASIACPFVIQAVPFCLVLYLLAADNRITFETARLIEVGMSPAEVQQVLGKPYSLPGCVFTPIVVTRDNGEDKVDALRVTPSFYPLGPGLPSHTLHSPQEEFPSYFGQFPQENLYQFYLAESCSILVFYDQDRRVTKVFALPTTVEPGNPWVRLQWLVSELLRR